MSVAANFVSAAAGGYSTTAHAGNRPAVSDTIDRANTVRHARTAAKIPVSSTTGNVLAVGDGKAGIQSQTNVVGHCSARRDTEAI